MAIIDARNVSKTYNGVTALDQLSLQVESQEIVALLGPDGAGKTSLMRILCNLISYDQSRNTRIRISGHDIASNFAAIKPLVGYMPQTFSLYPDLSVEENMTFFAGVYGVTGQSYRRQRDRMFEFSNLGPFADRRASALSGGMKQKLALSCALLHDPQILILDEPTTGVDPLSRRQFWRMLLELRSSGVTILVSTPYMDEVARADRAVCMFGGRKLTEASPEDLAAQFEGHVWRLERTPTPELLRTLNSHQEIKARRFGSELHIHTPRGVSMLSLAPKLATAGVEFSILVPVSPSIEDRFIQLMEAAS